MNQPTGLPPVGSVRLRRRAAAGSLNRRHQARPRARSRPRRPEASAATVAGSVDPATSWSILRAGLGCHIDGRCACRGSPRSRAASRRSIVNGHARSAHAGKSPSCDRRELRRPGQDERPGCSPPGHGSRARRPRPAVESSRRFRAAGRHRPPARPAPLKASVPEMHQSTHSSAASPRSASVRPRLLKPR